MSKIAVAVGVVVLAAGGAAFVAQSQANSALRREIAGLREEVRGAVKAVKENAATAPRHQVSDAADASTVINALPGTPNDEVTQLRREMVALRKSTTALLHLAETAQATKDLAKSADSVATKLTPANQWRNAGKATPEASTETVLWAAIGGDVDTLANTMTFTDAGRVKADAWFAGLSDSVRKQYGTPEKVIALLVAKDAAGLAGMQVLGQKEVAPDSVGLRVRVANTEGATKDETFVMKRGSDGWRMLLSDGVVEKFARKLGGK